MFFICCVRDIRCLALGPLYLFRVRVYTIGNYGFLGLSHQLFLVAVSIVYLIMLFQCLGSIIIVVSYIEIANHLEFDSLGPF